VKGFHPHARPLKGSSLEYRSDGGGLPHLPDTTGPLTAPSYRQSGEADIVAVVVELVV
jgi:hypothetical protein